MRASRPRARSTRSRSPSRPGYVLGWHGAPRRQYSISLSGSAEIEVGYGTVVRIGPGDVVLAEDLTGQLGPVIFAASPVSLTMCNPVLARSARYTKPRSSASTLFVWIATRHARVPFVTQRSAVRSVVAGM